MLIRLISRLGRHGLLFGLAKSAVLIAPLLAAHQFSKDLYGTIEWWLALSMVIGPVVGVGANGLVAFGTLGGPARRHLRTAVIFVLQVSCLLVALSLLLPLAGLGWREFVVGPVAMQCAVVVLQMTLAARLKALGLGAWASVAESSLYLSLLAAVICALSGAPFIVSYAGAMLVACVVLVVCLICFVPMPSIVAWPRRDYFSCLSAGSQFMIGGVAVFAFMAAPRVLLGFFAGADAVARFALVFRWLSIAVVVHQFLNTVFFRRFFGQHVEQERDKLLAITVFLVGLAALGIILFLHLVPHVFSFLPLPGPGSTETISLIAVSVVLWSATACMEGCLFRVDAKVAQIRAALIGLVALAGVSLGGMSLGLEPVFAMALAWLIGFLVIMAGQFWGFRQAKQHMPRLFSSSLMSASVVLVISLVLV